MRNQKGFTLIELLVVIAIIGLLSSVAVVSLNSIRAKARDTRRIADLRQVQTATELFYATYGYYPMSGGGGTWDHHWKFFSDCFERGVNCKMGAEAAQIPNFSSLMAKVPQDPLDNPDTLSDVDPTYYTGWGPARTFENYILRAQLETNHPALGDDADGGYRIAADRGCEDPWYCIKYNWPF